MLRDTVISLTYFIKKERDGLILILLTHYCTSCIDIMFLGILFFWTRFTVAASPITEAGDQIDKDSMIFLKVSDMNT